MCGLLGVCNTVGRRGIGRALGDGVGGALGPRLLGLGSSAAGRISIEMEGGGQGACGQFLIGGEEEGLQCSAVQYEGEVSVRLQEELELTVGRRRGWRACGGGQWPLRSRSSSGGGQAWRQRGS